MNTVVTKSLFEKMVAKWKVRLRDEDGLYMALDMADPVLPFAEVVTFKFTGPGRVNSYVVLQDDVVVWEEQFKGAPFVLPPCGGTVEINLGQLTLEGVKISDILHNPAYRHSGPIYRDITDPWEPAW